VPEPGAVAFSWPGTAQRLSGGPLRSAVEPPGPTRADACRRRARSFRLS